MLIPQELQLSRFLPSQTAVKAQLIWLSLQTWLLY